MSYSIKNCRLDSLVKFAHTRICWHLRWKLMSMDWLSSTFRRYQLPSYVLSNFFVLSIDLLVKINLSDFTFMISYQHLTRRNINDMQQKRVTYIKAYSINFSAGRKSNWYGNGLNIVFSKASWESLVIWETFYILSWTWIMNIHSNYERL